MNNLSVQQLRKVLEIKEKIEQLNSELDSVLSGSGGGSRRAAVSLPAQSKGRRGRPPGPAKKKGGRGPMSDEARARIAEAARLRWAKAKKAGKNRL